jgi:hypothetical protein
MGNIRTSDESETKLREIVASRRKKAIHAAAVSKTAVVAELISKEHKRQFKGR